VTRKSQRTISTSSASANGSEFAGKLKDLMRATLEGILDEIGCRSGSILLYNPHTGKLDVSEMIGGNGAQSKARRGELPAVPVEASSCIAGWVAENRTPLLVKDVAKDERFTGLRNSSREYQSNSFASIPLLDGDMLIGVVNVSEKSTGRPFTQQDLKTLNTLAEKITKSVRSGMTFRYIGEEDLSLTEELDDAVRQLANANYELAQMQGFHDNVLRSVSLGIITFDRSLKMIFCNDAAREIFGCDDSDGSQSVHDLDIHAADGLNWPEVLEKCLTEQTRLTLQQATCDAPDGRQLVLNVTCAPVDIITGIGGGTIIVEDVSRAVQVQRRIAQAEELATIGKLAACVAHELNNPLDGILRFANITLSCEDIDPKVKEYLASSREGLKRMSKILRSLLDYSRTIGKGLEDCDINELILAALKGLKPLQTRNKVAVKTDFAEDIPQARLTNFLDVFSNIIRNAHEAMPQGGELAISTTMRAGWLEIRFADTGVGIEPDMMNMIFEPFFTTKSSSESTGIGLTICSDIISRQGGTLDITSEPGKGTQVIVRVFL